MAKRGGALPVAAGRLKRSVFGMSPRGDAVRGWSAVIVAVIVYGVSLALRGAEGENYLISLLSAVDTFYLLYLVSTWIAMYRSTAEDARQWALAQETSSVKTSVAEALKGTRVFSGSSGLFTIVTLSLIGLLFALLLLPGDYAQGSELLLAILCVVGVTTAWMLLHTSFALYYTHLHYQRKPPGGLMFPGGQDPDPLDFAYFSFTVGISFAASDVQISARPIRRVALFHSVLAFFYNTAILALVINIVLTRAG